MAAALTAIAYLCTALTYGIVYGMAWWLWPAIVIAVLLALGLVGGLLYAIYPHQYTYCLLTEEDPDDINAF